jgi:hypothetical protein
MNAQFSFTFKPIRGFEYYKKDDILGSINGQGLVYEDGEWAEIVKAPKIMIKSYEAQIESGQVKFGCQTYSNEFIRTLVKCLEENNLKMDYRDDIIKLSKHLKD